MCFIFFFKQKTAYEMRISDWSADVCSSDLPKLDDYIVPIGKARIARAGKDVTLVGYSISVGHALAAAEKLAAEGIDAEVVDLRTIRPMDKDTIVKSVQKTNRLVEVEEGFPQSGVGSAISASMMELARS